MACIAARSIAADKMATGGVEATEAESYHFLGTTPQGTTEKDW